MLEAGARRLDAPLHLVTPSLGSAVAPTTALSNVADIKSISTFEVSPGFLPDQGAIYDAMLTISDNYEAAIDVGQHDPAKLIIDYWGVEGSFDAMPDATEYYCLATAASNILD